MSFGSSYCPTVNVREITAESSRSAQASKKAVLRDSSWEAIVAIPRIDLTNKGVTANAEGPALSASEPRNSSPAPQPIDEQVELDQTLMYQILVQQVLTSPSDAPEAAPNPEAEANPCPDTTLDWV